MPYYRVKHKATGRTEIVEAGDRRTARNAVAMDAFEVEIATAEDGFRLAKENREIIVAGAVKDPDQPGLPLDPPAAEFPRRVAFSSLKTDWEIEVGELRDLVIERLGVDPTLPTVDSWTTQEREEVRAFFEDKGGPLPAVLAPMMAGPARVGPTQASVDEATIEAVAILEDSGVVAPLAEELAVDARLLCLALNELEIRVTEAIVSGWSDEERGQAWEFANASAVAGDMGGPELPDFLRVYTASGLAWGAR